MRREKKKKHAKSCPCLVFSLPYWILSVDLCCYWKVSGIAHFFPCCLLYLYLRRRFDTNKHLSYLSLFRFLASWVIYLFAFFTTTKTTTTRQDKTTNKQTMNSARKFPSVSCNMKKNNNNGSFFTSFFKKGGKKGQWLKILL